MEIEQITKRLEWLDDERRKDKAVISTLENRISELEEKNSISKKEFASLESKSFSIQFDIWKIGAS